MLPACFNNANLEEQKEFWILAGELPTATPDGFYRRVNRTLEKVGFAAAVWNICTPVYAERSKGGRPGEQHTFGADVTEESVLISQLYKMADNLTAKIREDHRSYRTITLRLRYNDMEDATRTVSLEEPSDRAEDIFPTVLGLLKTAWDRRASIRLVGLKLSHIYGSVFRSELPLEAHAQKRLKMQNSAPCSPC